MGRPALPPRLLRFASGSSLRAASPSRLGSRRADVLQHLSDGIRRIESAGVTPRKSTRMPSLEELLPQGKLPAGALVELMPAADGAGLWTLALFWGLRACGEDRALVVADPARCFYPPAASRFGVDWKRLIVVRPENRLDAYVAMDQCLRCPAVGAVIGRCERLRTVDSRRLQLAAESGGSLGLLLRPAELGAASSFATLRLRIAPVGTARSGRRLRVEVERCHGGKSNFSFNLEIDDETGDVRLPAPLASAAPLARPARASG